MWAHTYRLYLSCVFIQQRPQIYCFLFRSLCIFPVLTIQITIQRDRKSVCNSTHASLTLNCLCAVSICANEFICPKGQWMYFNVLGKSEWVSESRTGNPTVSLRLGMPTTIESTTASYICSLLLDSMHMHTHMAFLLSLFLVIIFK